MKPHVEGYIHYTSKKYLIYRRKCIYVENPTLSTITITSTCTVWSSLSNRRIGVGAFTAKEINTIVLTGRQHRLKSIALRTVYPLESSAPGQVGHHGACIIANIS